MVVEQMRPSELRFTHDSVSCRFSDGHTLEETLKQLLNDEIHMPPLVVMYHRGHWFVVRGNRRLYLLRKLENIGKIQEVTVIKREFEENLFNKQFTSKNMGTSIRIRGDRYIEAKLRQCINDWRYPNTRPSSSAFANDWMDSNTRPSSISTNNRINTTTRSASSASMAVHRSESRPHYSFVDYSPPSRTPSVRSYTPPPRPLPPEKKDDSWCTIL